MPKAVVRLLSALRFHDLGSQAAHEVWLALPEGARLPSVEYPAIRIVRLRDAAYSEEIETVMDEGVPIRVYGLDKTIADCIKFRHKIGLDVAPEAIKNAWQRRLVSMDELTHCARAHQSGGAGDAALPGGIDGKKPRQSYPLFPAVASNRDLKGSRKLLLPSSTESRRVTRRLPPSRTYASTTTPSARPLPRTSRRMAHCFSVGSFAGICMAMLRIPTSFGVRSSFLSKAW